MLQQFTLRSHARCNGPKKDNPQHRKHHAAGRRHIDKEGKQAVRPLWISLAQSFGNEGAATCAKHKAHRSQNHQEGHNEVHRSEGPLPHKVGNKKPVHNAVN